MLKLSLWVAFTDVSSLSLQCPKKLYTCHRLSIAFCSPIKRGQTNSTVPQSQGDPKTVERGPKGEPIFGKWESKGDPF